MKSLLNSQFVPTPITMPTNHDIPQEALNDLFTYQETVDGGFRRQTKLNPKYYDAVVYVFDRKVGDHVERLMLLGPGSIRRHKHGKIDEEFKVLGAYKTPKGFMIGSGGPVELKKGSEAVARPGAVHGFEIHEGFFLVRIFVRNFDPADIYEPYDVISEARSLVS